MSELKDIREFFDFSNGTGKCLVVDCKSNLKTTKPSHLYRHFQQKHPSKLPDIFPEKVMNLERLRMETIYICVEHVAVCGRPILSLKDSSFQRLLQPRFEQLNGTPHKLTNSEIRRIIGTMIHEIAIEIRSRITREIEGNYYAVMIDTVTKHFRCILGVNIQWLNGDKIVERTIGMERVMCRHTAENIADMTINILKNKYGLSMDHWVSTTVDNARNMLATVRKVDKILSQQHTETVNEHESSDESDYESDDENYVERLWLQPDFQEHLLQSAATGISSRNRTIFHNSVDLVHCGGHTGQLCVEETLEKSNCKPVIDKAREIVKKLHCQALILQLEAMNLPIPPSDNTTRWFSKYLMVYISIISNSN